MPRARKMVMEKQDPEVLLQAQIKKALKTFEPFKVVDGDLASVDEEKPWALIYTDPFGTSGRKLLGMYRKKRKATELRDLLGVAWVMGRMSQKMGD
jgi:hypothetical protein